MADRTVDPFRAFYDRALPVVYGYVRGRLLDADRVEAVTREVFFALVRRWPLPAAARYEMESCLGVARDKLVEELRRQEREVRRHRRAGSQIRWPHAAESMLEPGQRLLAATGNLPASQRAALILSRVDGLTVQEVADVLGKSVRATDGLIARGAAKVGSELLEAADA